jgi:hypothetical protein
MTGPDDLRRSLDNVAASIDVGDLDIQAVRSSARRRTRRFRLGASLGVVALLSGATVAVVAFDGDDEPDTLATAEADEPDSTDVAPTTVDGAPPSTELSTAPARSVEVVERAASAGQRVGVGGAPEYGEWSAGWQDGFIVGSQSFPPQPLPDELPEEVLALFPQEVRDVFGGELPATISEATQMLSDAGLLETVTEILAANPAASDAIYSVETEPTPPTLDVRYTTDGVTWEPVEMTLPPGASYFNTVDTVGGRLVVSYQSQDPFTGMSVDGIARVATTENLVDWTVQEIAAPPPPVELPTGTFWSVNIAGFAANESGWVANVYAGAQFDPLVLIPADVRAEFEQSTDGFGSSYDETGVVLERTEAGEKIEVEYTWDELGISPEVAVYLVDFEQRPTTWSATWGGVPTPSTAASPTERIVATPAGFVGLDTQIWFSADGLDWTAEPLPFEDGYVSSAFAFDGGIVAFVDTVDGTQIFRLDERGGSPELLAVPDVPERLNAGFGFGSRLGVVMDAAEYPAPPPLVVEADGYRLTIDNATGAVEVVELVTDEVVATSSFRFGLVEESPIVFDDDGVTVTDPTGAVVVVFPAEALEAASTALYESGPGSEMEQHEPDLWLLATLDGETFVLDDLPDASGDSFMGPGAMVANGSRLLLQVDGTWVVYDLA